MSAMEEKPIVKSSSKTPEEAIALLGGFRQFQWIIVASFIFMFPPRVFQVFFMVFGARNPPWRCVANSTVCLLNSTLSNNNRERCNMPRADWEYTVAKDETIATEFDLQCDKEWMNHLLNSIVFVGWGLGAVVMGWVADNYGRKNVIFLAQLMVICLGFISSFLRSVPALIICRFLIGVFIPAGIVQSFVLVSEYVSTDSRPFACLLLFVGFASSAAIMPLKAYYIRSWKVLSLVCTAPYIFTLLSYFFVPESIRWIRLKGDEDQIVKILKRIAYWNKKELPTDLTIEHPNDNVVHRNFSVIDIFRTRKLALTSIILGYGWLANGMVYYSLVYAATDLGGSIYFNFFLLAVISIPGNAIAMYLCNRIGRKKCVATCMLVASVFCIAIAFISKENQDGRLARVTCGVIGKLLIGVSFSSIYVWSVELYPTTIRANGMGFLQVTSRIGAASAPWVARGLLPVHTAAPYLLMGAAALVASLLLLFVAETKGKEISETGADTYVKVTLETNAEINDMSRTLLHEGDNNTAL